MVDPDKSELLNIISGSNNHTSVGESGAIEISGAPCLSSIKIQHFLPSTTSELKALYLSHSNCAKIQVRKSGIFIFHFAKGLAR